MEWEKDFNIVGNEQVESILYQRQIWVELSGITATPAIYFNGFKMPDHMKLRI